MAKAAGARVIATSRSAEKARQAKMLGADVSIDSSRQDFQEVVRGEGGADGILDMVGGEFVRKNLDALKPDGRLCQIAFLSGWPWFASGRVGVPLDKVFPLADAAAAHAYLESGGHLGKGGSAGSGDSDVKFGVSEKITVTF